MRGRWLDFARCQEVRELEVSLRTSTHVSHVRAHLVASLPLECQLHESGDWSLRVYPSAKDCARCLVGAQESTE